VAGEQRQERVREFQDPKNPGFAVMILSPKAGGVGLTLTAANHVIHLSRWWNPAVEDQCTDRIYRMGQEKPVHVYYPMAKHPSPDLADYSFDLTLDALLDRKRALSRDMLVPPILPGVDEGELFAATIGGMKPAQPARYEPEVSIDDLDCMDPIQFENWALDRLRRRGFRSSRTPRSGDAGADGVLIHEVTKERVIVQCKHRQADAICDHAAVEDLLKARAAYCGADQLIAITNASGFTTQAQQQAFENGIRLVSRRDIMNWADRGV
jgi:hypothetical protein